MNIDPRDQYVKAMTRRTFFRHGAMGLGIPALATLMPNLTAQAAADGPLPGLPHFAPKAKRAIYLFMGGGPSQMDMFDYKPKLADMFDKDFPESVRMGQRLTTMTSGQERFPLAPSAYKFKQYGQSGAWVSEILPYTAKMVDDICIIKSMHTEAINHDPGVTFLCTGNQIPGRPSIGSWLSYGLGSMNSDLPTFVVMTPSWTGRKVDQPIFSRLWGTGFLPGKHQGVALRSTGDPVLYLSNPPGVDAGTRRRMLDRLAKFNQRTLEDTGDPETQTRIDQYEMAFRMQTSVPELTDLSQETKETLDMYGPEVNIPGTFARSALLARRLIERNVRFVQLFHRGWDQHENVTTDLPHQCHDVDQPCWALIQDLKQRGLLDDTLVVWSGEFGRTVYCQGALTKENYGRDHHPRCFTMWMAGGGVKPGLVYGETDDFSYNITANPVHISDMNATILHCMGIDHSRFTFPYQGLDMRLTGVEQRNVVHDILA